MANPKVETVAQVGTNLTRLAVALCVLFVNAGTCGSENAKWDRETGVIVLYWNEVYRDESHGTVIPPVIPLHFHLSERVRILLGGAGLKVVDGDPRRVGVQPSAAEFSACDAIMVVSSQGGASGAFYKSLGGSYGGWSWSGAWLSIKMDLFLRDGRVLSDSISKKCPVPERVGGVIKAPEDAPFGFDPEEFHGRIVKLIHSVWGQQALLNMIRSGDPNDEHVYPRRERNFIGYSDPNDQTISLRRDRLPQEAYMVAREDGPTLSTWMQHGCSEVLVELGGQSVEGLADLLVDPRMTVRWTAIDALGELADKNLFPPVEPVRALLQDRSESVRSRAADVLGKIGDKESTHILKKLLKDKDHGVRYAAAGALEKITGHEYSYVDNQLFFVIGTWQRHLALFGGLLLALIALLRRRSPNFGLWRGTAILMLALAFCPLTWVPVTTIIFCLTCLFVFALFEGVI